MSQRPGHTLCPRAHTPDLPSLQPFSTPCFETGSLCRSGAGAGPPELLILLLLPLLGRQSCVPPPWLGIELRVRCGLAKHSARELSSRQFILTW